MTDKQAVLAGLREVEAEMGNLLSVPGYNRVKDAILFLEALTRHDKWTQEEIDAARKWGEETAAAIAPNIQVSDDAVVERVRFIHDFLRDMVRVGGVDRREQLLAWKLIDEGRQKLAALSATNSEAVSELEKRYHELLFAVGKKYEGEDRHETALRYIREREADRQVAGGAAKLGSRAP
jgi:hypothetical protein